MFETRCGLKLGCGPCIEARLSVGEQDDICDTVAYVAGQREPAEQKAERALYDELSRITTEPFVTVRMLETAKKAYNVRRY